MSDEGQNPENVPMISVPSSRFGDLVVPANSVIEFPSGLIGFPRATKYILVEHKPPFSWLHSIEDPGLAFVVIDGAEFGQHYSWKPPLSDRDCEFKEDDEFAILIIVTVRPDPTMTTGNLKAPLFVNIRNRRGVQVIFDDSRFSTRFPLWTETKEEESQKNDPKKDNEGSGGSTPPKTK